MGIAIWLYIWCLDRVTREADGLGYVFGGAPVKVGTIAGDLKRSVRALRRDLAKLRGRYLALRWTPFGYVIAVKNSRKFGIWKRLPTLTKDGMARDKSGKAATENGRAKTENGRSKEDAAIAAIAAVGGTAASESEPWEAIGQNLPLGTPKFQVIWKQCHPTRNGHLVAEAMERCIQRCNSQGVKVPPPFYQAKREVESREREAAAPRELKIVALEVPPA
jgi:hypothetical protein